MLAFMQFLHDNALSPRVIANYIASLKAKAKMLQWSCTSLLHPSIPLFIKSITNNGSFQPKFKGNFDIPTLRKISLACNNLSDPDLYRAIFLVSFFAFLCISNIAPHSKAAFSPFIHLLRKDVIFAPPGAHILIKWANNMQQTTSHKFVQIPSLNDIELCPVTAIRRLLRSRQLEKNQPLFAECNPPFLQVIDTKIRDALRHVLEVLHIPSNGHRFHVFRRSVAIAAFWLNVDIDNIKAHWELE